MIEVENEMMCRSLLRTLQSNMYLGNEYIRRMPIYKLIGDRRFVTHATRFELYDPRTPRNDLFVKVYDEYIPLFDHIKKWVDQMKINPEINVPFRKGTVITPAEITLLETVIKIRSLRGRESWVGVKSHLDDSFTSTKVELIEGCESGGGAGPFMVNSATVHSEIPMATYRKFLNLDLIVEKHHDGNRLTFRRFARSSFIQEALSELYSWIWVANLPITEEGVVL